MKPLTTQMPASGKALRTEGVRFCGPGWAAWLELLGPDPLFALSPGALRLTIEEVAQRMNFSSEFHFSRFFHRGVDMSPTQFRKRCRT